MKVKKDQGTLESLVPGKRFKKDQEPMKVQKRPRSP
jgi:hypothetical protein